MVILPDHIKDSKMTDYDRYVKLLAYIDSTLSDSSLDSIRDDINDFRAAVQAACDECAPE